MNTPDQITPSEQDQIEPGEDSVPGEFRPNRSAVRYGIFGLMRELLQDHMRINNQPAVTNTNTTRPEPPVEG